MSQEYFEEYCFQIVVDKEELGEEYLKYWDQEPIILPLWDPMGALAE
jgi:bleomycin hydrolase